MNETTRRAAIDPNAVLFRSPRKRGRIMVLLSGRGSNFLAIHDAILAGTIDADVALVFSNKEDAPGLAAARARGLDTLFINPKLYPEKPEYDKAIMREAVKRDVDLVVLAGYMKIVTPGFCQAYQHRIINIHPALLPCVPRLARPAEGHRPRGEVQRLHDPLRGARGRRRAHHPAGLRPRPPRRHGRRPGRPHPDGRAQDLPGDGAALFPGPARSARPPGGHPAAPGLIFDRSQAAAQRPSVSLRRLRAISR